MSTNLSAARSLGTDPRMTNVYMKFYIKVWAKINSVTVRAASQMITFIIVIVCKLSKYNDKRDNTELLECTDTRLKLY